MDVFPEGDQGKHAVTHYKVLERFGYVTLVQCKLETGRTHQIRAHMKFIGHPLFNDERYGGDRILKGTTFTKYKQFIQNCFEALPRPALHAKTLAFTQPATKERMCFESDLPDDMQTVLEMARLRGKQERLTDSFLLSSLKIVIHVIGNGVVNRIALNWMATNFFDQTNKLLSR